MADNDPKSSGEDSPKPGGAPKVQPKKETVRISLPPKPTSTSTIKLPSLPAGGKPGSGTPGQPAAKPTGAAAPAAPGPATPGAPAKGPAAKASAPPPGARVAKPPGSAPATGPRPAAAAAPAARGRSATAPRQAQPSGLDMGLTIAAAVLSIGALVSVLLLLNMK